MARIPIALAATVLAWLAAAPTPATAYPLYPWCAQYGGRSGGTNCYFANFGQCQASISGRGGYCYENPFYRAYGSFYTPAWQSVGPYGYDAPTPRRAR